MKKSASFLFASALLMMSVSSSSAGNLITGLAGCMMKIGGTAGKDDFKEVITQVREPVSGEYMDLLLPRPQFAFNRTAWMEDVVGMGSTFAYNIPKYIAWGSIDHTKTTYGFYGVPTIWKPVVIEPKIAETNAWGTVSDNSNPTWGLGVDGWTYRKGTFRGNFDHVFITTWDESQYGGITYSSVDAYGIYRTKDSVLSVSGGTVFETCTSLSNSGNGNWIKGAYVDEKELNTAFKEFESKVLKSINQNKINLVLISESSKVDSATVEKNILFSSSAYFKVSSNNKESVRLGTVSEDATTFKNIFKNY